MNTRHKDRVGDQSIDLMQREVKLHKEHFVISQKQGQTWTVPFSFWNKDRKIPRMIWHSIHYSNPESRILWKETSVIKHWKAGVL